jgi:hypothetical protein
MTTLEILLRSQDQEIEARHVDPPHFMPGDKRSSFSTGGANPNLRQRGGTFHTDAIFVSTDRRKSIMK